MLKVSVIIPTYNRKDYVQEAIDSVLAQTYTDYEIIVIDDGSTDDTGVILQERYGDAIRYLWQVNKGESAARNNGIHIARGEYIALLDSDDLWLPNKLTLQISVLDLNIEMGLVYCLAYRMDSLGNPYRGSPLGIEYSDLEKSLKNLLIHNYVTAGGSTAVIRRECFENVGNFNESLQFGEDWDMWIRIRQNYEITMIDEPLALIRIHPGSQRGWFPRPSQAEQCFNDHIYILETALKTQNNKGEIDQSLFNEVIEKEHMNLAFVEYRMGMVSKARKRLSRATKNCPGLIPDQNSLTKNLRGRASIIASEDPSLSGLISAENYLKIVSENLPDQLHEFKINTRNIIAHVAIDLGFQYHSMKNTSLSRWYLWEGIKRDPTWLKNRGIWSIFIRKNSHRYLII